MLTAQSGRPGSRRIVLNGRFLTQPQTGVQRFAMEITRSLDALAAEVPPSERPDATLLVPPGNKGVAGFSQIRTREIGHLTGHLWEQFVLPAHVRGQVLVNLGNTCPLTIRRQIVVIHDAGIYAVPESYGARFRRLNRLQHKAILRLGIRIATVSQFSRTEIARYLGIDPSTIALLTEGAEHIMRTPPADDTIEHHALGNRRFILAVGSLAPHKNLSALAPAADFLTTQGMELVVAGGANRRIFADGAAPQPSIRHIGKVTDGELRALYEHASGFVFPSLYEGLGLPALEAMACGCPVMAANIGALSETCGEAALYFDPRDPMQLVVLLRELMASPDLQARLREKGRARAARFTWRQAAERLLGIIPCRRSE